MTAAEALVTVEHRDGVVVLALNRPAQSNALDQRLLDELVGQLRRAADAASGIIIAANGRNFCAGGDLEMLETWRGLSITERQERFAAGQKVVTLIAEMSVPVISAVQGAAVGAGFDLAIAADLCIAEEPAWFHSAFAAVGLVPDFGGTWFLPRAIGIARAKALVLANDKIDARTAADWGLIYRVVEAGAARDEAIAVAIALQRAGSGEAFMRAKHALRQAASQSLPESLALAATDQSYLVQTTRHRDLVNRGH